MRVGAFESPNGTVQPYRDADARYGTRLALARQYWNLDANIPAIQALVSDGRVPVLSFAPHHWRYPTMNLVTIGLGYADDLLTGLGRALGAMDAEMYLTLQHEPDLGVQQSKFLVSDWQKAYRRFYLKIKPLVPRAHVGPIFSGPWHSGQSWSQWALPATRADFVGTDPYCHAAQWRTPLELLSYRASILADTYPSVPIILAEVGCGEDPRKQDWIASVPSALSAFSEIEGMSWFDVLKEEDWRMNSSDAALAASQQMLAALIGRR